MKLRSELKGRPDVKYVKLNFLIMDKKNTPKADVKPAEEYRGVDVNQSDDNKVTPEMVKKDVKELNNNPRNTDMDDM